MGGIGGGGGGKSGNKNLDLINDIYTGQAQGGVGGFNALGNLLGLDGSGASSQALQDYWNSSGGQFLLNQGLDSVNNKYHSLGLGRSGAAMKAMENYRQDLASTKLDNYLGQLARYSQLGLGAGGLLANAGQYSKGAGGGLGGLLGGVGGLLSGIGAISDRRAKTNIERIGDWDRRGDGLGKYRFSYKWAPETMLEGVMADEVKQLRPAAFIANFARGYDGVNYAMLGAA